MKKRIFLSGPITGLINENKGAFNDAASVLRAMGYVVFIPYEIMQQHDCSEFSHMKYCEICCAVMIEKADLILQLNGWEKSSGCAIEKACCDLFKKEYMTLTQFLKEIEDEKPV